jgi:hypothetical protein
MENRAMGKTNNFLLFITISSFIETFHRLVRLFATGMPKIEEEK